MTGCRGRLHEIIFEAETPEGKPSTYPPTIAGSVCEKLW
jgi:hypothetical protein